MADENKVADDVNEIRKIGADDLKNLAAGLREAAESVKTHLPVMGPLWAKFHDLAKDIEASIANFEASVSHGRLSPGLAMSSLPEFEPKPAEPAPEPAPEPGVGGGPADPSPTPLDPGIGGGSTDPSPAPGVGGGPTDPVVSGSPVVTPTTEQTEPLSTESEALPTEKPEAVN